MSFRARSMAALVGTLALGATLLACPSSPPAEGEGEGEGEPIDVGPPPSGFDVAPPAGGAGEACSTSQWWVRGDRGSALMHPGGDCVGCHESRGGGPDLTVAGTVSGAVDDEDDCRGIPGAQVELIGPDDEVFLTLETNGAGNFYSSASLTGHTPYTVRISYQGRTREMASPQTEGACMACHSAAGDFGAPGRIYLP